MNHQMEGASPSKSSEYEEKSLFSRVVAYFKRNDWRYTQIKNQPVLQIPFQGENGEWMCYARANEELEQFCFYSIAPLKIPELQRGAVAEFITRINYGMVTGHFGLDFRDGELYYKTAVEVEKGNLSEDIMARLVYINVIVMDEYLPIIMNVSYGQVSPQEAIKKAIAQRNPQKQKTDEFFSGLRNLSVVEKKGDRE